MALVGLYALTLQLALAWVPRLWLDEAVTASMASRGPRDIALISGVSGDEIDTGRDLVHAAYYVLVSGWTRIWGTSDLALRSFSAVAVAVGAVLLMFFARWVGRRAALAAALVYPLLPVTLWMGAEARSFGLAATLAIATVLVWLWCATEDDTSRWRWACAGVIWIVASVVFLYNVLLAPVLLLVVLLKREGRLGPRGLVTLGLSGVVLLLWADLLAQQREQIAWIDRLTDGAVWQRVLAEEFFGTERGTPTLLHVAGVGWLAVLVGLVVVAHRARTDEARTVWWLASWLALPTLTLILVGAVSGTSIFIPRYGVISAPAVALLIGVACSELRATVAGRAVVVGVAGVLAIGAGQMIVERADPGSRSSWEHVETTLVDGDLGPGDLIYLDGMYTEPMFVLEPDRLRGATWVNIGPPPPPARFFTAAGEPVDGGTPVPSGTPRVWVITDKRAIGEPAEFIAALLAAGCEVGAGSREQHGIDRAVVARFDCPADR